MIDFSQDLGGVVQLDDAAYSNEFSTTLNYTTGSDNPWHAAKMSDVFVVPDLKCYVWTGLGSTLGLLYIHTNDR